MRPPVDVAIDVYAFVDGVAYVTLYYEHENINEWVIAKQLAQYTDENFMVKINAIVTRRRPLCERKYPPKPFVWNQCDIKPSELLVIDDVYNGASIFPFLTSVKLDVNTKSEEGGRLKKNCQDLYTIAGINRLERGGIKCQLCDTYLNDISQVRLHLFTKLHRDREKEIKFEVATH
uniref:C2H2-type domain-containing protein n=1 Tax=Lutzomyia longipalpis TaxID=7200 RepID=A0A1B0CH42_LUTLO